MVSSLEGSFKTVCFFLLPCLQTAPAQRVSPPQHRLPQQHCPLTEHRRDTQDTLRETWDSWEATAQQGPNWVYLSRAEPELSTAVCSWDDNNHREPLTPT